MATNRINIAIEPNCDFAAGSVVTISGIVGTLTQDRVGMPIFPANNGAYISWFDPERTSWSRARGMLKLIVSDSKFEAHRLSEFYFYVQNPSTSQPSPVVNISCTVLSPGPRNSPGPVSTMVTPGPRDSSMSTGQDPLLVNPPEFRERVIAQHNPLRHASNMISVTIIPNFHVTAGSNITISGLKGTITDSTACLPISTMEELCTASQCTPDFEPDDCQVLCSGQQSVPSPLPINACGEWLQSGTLFLRYS